MPKALTNLDLDLVRTFATIAGTGNFTRAAETLRRQQSTISLQVQRLETALGHKLIERTPRAVKLTSEGETFLGYARRLLDLNDEVVARVSEPQMHGTVRLGTPEDFATRHLPDVLARFTQAYPAVALEVTCDLTLNLLERFRKGAFDLTLIKRERAAMSPGGIRVWREPLVWVMSERDFSICGGADAPRRLACALRVPQTCDRGIGPRSSSLGGSPTPADRLPGSLAAVKAGLGVTVLPRDMVPSGLHVVDGSPLPDLKDTEIALFHKERISVPARRLMEHVVRSLG